MAWALALCLNLSSAAKAAPWVSAGSRGQGMGGAVVAAVTGPLAAYHNPAALGYGRWGLDLWGDGRLEVRGRGIEGAHDLFDLAANCPPGGGGKAYCTNANVDLSLSKLTGGASAQSGAGLNMEFGRFGFFAETLDFFGASPLLDPTNNTIATLSGNRSALVVRGGFFNSVGMGFGTELFETGLFAGTSVRVVQGHTAFSRLAVVVDTPTPNVAFRKANESLANSVNAAVDAGLLWDPRRVFDADWAPRIGVSGRNLNAPQFRRPIDAAAFGDQPDRYRLPAQARAGVAISPLRWITLAADADLTRNLTLLDGYVSREFSAGLELAIPLGSQITLSLRGGLTKNTTVADPAALTAGIGLRLGRMELSAAGSPPRYDQRVKSLEGQVHRPSRVEFTGALSFRFGDAEEEEKPAPRRARKAAPRPVKAAPPLPHTSRPSMPRRLEKEPARPQSPTAPEPAKDWGVDKNFMFVR